MNILKIMKGYLAFLLLSMAFCVAELTFLSLFVIMGCKTSLDCYQTRKETHTNSENTQTKQSLKQN